VLRAVLSPGAGQPLRLLCLGAHSDDIEIGCGGTILRLAAEFPDLEVRWIVFGAEGERKSEAQSSAASFLDQLNHQVDVLGFQNSYFPFNGADIKDRFEALKLEFEPSLVMTHRLDDAHQDHRLLASLAYNTFRDHLIMEYEIPKYDGDLGNPNLFVPLTRKQVHRKVELIGRHFRSQQVRGWFTDETFLALARLRGIGCNAPEGLAEAFHVRKLVI